MKVRELIDAIEDYPDSIVCIAEEDEPSYRRDAESVTFLRRLMIAGEDKNSRDDGYILITYA